MGCDGVPDQQLVPPRPPERDGSSNPTRPRRDSKANDANRDRPNLGEDRYPAVAEMRRRLAILLSR
jgi:hypothetical protein